MIGFAWQICLAVGALWIAGIVDPAHGQRWLIVIAGLWPWNCLGFVEGAVRAVH